tara:strand:+ start:128 stop:295 length:168 start_codon:yes stop_codon:yes gene_type:complete
MNTELEKINKKIKMLEDELSDLYRENLKLRQIYAAIQELQELHDAPAAKFTYYLG